MKNKYYTPEISEFHVGFEYESKTIIYMPTEQVEHWTSLLIKDPNTYWLTESLKDGDIRVKYLDKEDIESMGWEYRATLPGRTKMLFIGFSIDLDYDPDSQYMEVYNGDPHEMKFCGYIKNKSELKRLMKQLGI